MEPVDLLNLARTASVAHSSSLPVHGGPEAGKLTMYMGSNRFCQHNFNARPYAAHSGFMSNNYEQGCFYDRNRVVL